MAMTLTATQQRLLDEFQRDLPLVPRPFAVIAERLGADETTVLELLERLQADGVVSRVGAVVEPHRAGWSTLAAMAVPGWALPQIADFVSGLPEVNHNYEREHRLNLWFVVTAPTAERVRQVLAMIEYRTGVPVLDLPLVEAFRLDLGFRLQWR
jgi:DNA-binding Lrp family transcriptional regulator